jgi:hypothetical protein
MSLNERVEKLLLSKSAELVNHSPKVAEKLVGLILKSQFEDIIKCPLLSSQAFFDKFVWPNVSENVTDNLVMLFAVYVTAFIYSTGKLVEIDDAERLQALILRLIQMFGSSQYSNSQKTVAIRGLSSLIFSLRDDNIRTTMAPIFSIASWRSLQFMPLKRLGLESTYEAIKERQSHMTKKEQVVNTMLTGFIDSLCSYIILLANIDEDNFPLVTGIIELLCLTLSQLPTRRFLKLVIQQSNVLQLLRTKKAMVSINASIDLLDYYLKFPVDEFTGEMLDAQQLNQRHQDNVSRFQSAVFTNYKAELGDMILTESFVDMDLRRLTELLSKLTSEDINELLQEMELSKRFLDTDMQKMEALYSFLQLPLDPPQILAKLDSLPTEKSLREAFELSIWSLPKLGPQFLSLSDLLIRMYWDLRADSYREILTHINRTTSRFKKPSAQSRLSGASRHAIKLGKYDLESRSIVSSKTESSRSIEATISLDLGNANPEQITEWNNLEEHDVVLFAKIGPKNSDTKDLMSSQGVTMVRSATIKRSSNNNGSIKTSNTSKSFRITAVLDSEDQEDLDMFQDFNLLIKLPQQLKSFTKPLESIASVIDGDDELLPDWLLEVILGYGDVNAGSFEKLENKSCISFCALRKERLESALSDFDTISDKETKKRKLPNNELKQQHLYCDVEISGKTATLKESRVSPLLDLTPKQIRVLISSSLEGLTVVDGAGFTGKKTLLSLIATHNTRNYPHGRTLIVTKNISALNTIMEKIITFGVSAESVFNLANEEDQKEKAEAGVSRLYELLKIVDSIASKLEIEGAHGNDAISAENFYKYHIDPLWKAFLCKVKRDASNQSIMEGYPFKSFGEYSLDESLTFSENLKSVLDHFSSISIVFDQVKRLGPLRFLESPKARAEYLLSTQARVIGVTSDALQEKISLLKKSQLQYDSILFAEAGQLNIFETLHPLLLGPKVKPSRIVMIGDNLDLGPSVRNKDLGAVSGLSTSLFETFLKDGIDFFTLDTFFGRDDFNVKVVPVEGVETEPQTGFFQNLKECESCIEYVKNHFRPESVALLTPFEGQRVLLEMVANDKLNQMPIISTIEDYRGDRSKNVVVSMVHSNGEKFDKRTIYSLYQSASSQLVILCSPSYQTGKEFSFI